MGLKARLHKSFEQGRKLELAFPRLLVTIWILFPSCDIVTFYGTEKLLVILRDGRKVVGILRSYDQFANLVLQDTVERIIVEDKYSDIPRGVFVIRGENVVLLGEIVSLPDWRTLGETLWCLNGIRLWKLDRTRAETKRRDFDRFPWPRFWRPKRKRPKRESNGKLRNKR